MVKKQWVLALVLYLLIPLVWTAGGALFNRINPEAAAGHPGYVHNYQVLSLLKHMSLWVSEAGVVVLWLLACLLVIRSKKRSQLWMILAAFGPFGFAVLAMLNDRAPAETARYSRLMRKLNVFLRIGCELCMFVFIWVLSYQATVLKRTWMIRHEAAITGMSTAQIMDQQNASGGMWAFGEGIEVMYLVILFYLLLPVVFNVAGHVVQSTASPKARLQE
jgi:hypothetical protein